MVFHVGCSRPEMILKLFIFFSSLSTSYFSGVEYIDIEKLIADTNGYSDSNAESSKTRNVFDSYYKLTDLEHYPDVCVEYSNETCAKLWLREIDKVLIRNRNRYGNVHFQYSTNINRKNLRLKKKFQLRSSKIGLEFKKKVQKFHWKTYKSATMRRIFKKITATTRSKNISISHQLIKIGNQMSTIYNKARPCFKECLHAGEHNIRNLFHAERDYETLSGFWTAWRNETGAKIRKLFINRMNLEKKGARENGHEDLASFILEHSFEEKNFQGTVMKLYENILPLYKELHGYVRYCLVKYYPGKFDKDGPIPAHILGNVWAQQWTNILPIIQQCRQKHHIDNVQDEVNLKLRGISVKQMFKMTEEFYESIGMYKMTDKFWERSMFTKPKGRIANCHGSAHDLGNGEDFRIKMCTEKNLIDFTTIHHEMGHIQYYMAYRHLPMVFRGSANPGFHEAIGDTIALAVKTPEHLHSIGLISQIPDSEHFDLDYLMGCALEKVVFLPFALTMDSYIWGVYNGSVAISELNKHWWDLRYKYQGLKAPVQRSENDFDPGAKYHIAFGVSYIRYFVSFIIQFQFYESMCQLSGYEGPLHRCDFYKSKEAGSKLLEMLKQGKSQHWRKTMKILTGKGEIETESLLKFFEPLHKWLKKENERLNIPVGW